MIHARKDYNRIQDPEGLIGENEPVFLLRAKDKTAPNTLRHWAQLQLNEGNPGLHVQLALNHTNIMEEWQKEHGCKMPDVPAE